VTGILPRLALLWLLVFVVATEVPVLHAHDAEGAALYNEECPLTRLATAPPGTTPAPAVQVSAPESVPAAFRPPRPIAPAGPAAPAFAPRAPPSGP
jgi:hypothetical protein